MRKLSVTELCRISIEQFKESPKLPLVLVLDNIRSLYNVGSLFRTADAFRLTKLYLCGITGCPPSAEIHKTALGAEDSVAWEYVKSSLEAVKHLKDEGYYTMAVEQVEGSLMLDTNHFHTSQPHALVLGNEVKGVEQDVCNACNASLEIPQFGTKHSLNVASAGAIAIWEFFRQYRQTNQLP